MHSGQRGRALFLPRRSVIHEFGADRTGGVAASALDRVGRAGAGRARGIDLLAARTAGQGSFAGEAPGGSLGDHAAITATPGRTPHVFRPSFIRSTQRKEYFGRRVAEVCATATSSHGLE